ncbi:hypothetical protein LCGC14_2393460, partial [marine sediment metagenome]
MNKQTIEGLKEIEDCITHELIAKRKISLFKPIYIDILLQAIQWGKRIEELESACTTKDAVIKTAMEFNDYSKKELATLKVELEKWQEMQIKCQAAWIKINNEIKQLRCQYAI